MLTGLSGITTIRILRKCKNCGKNIYIIEKSIGDEIICEECGYDHHLTVNLSGKIVLTRI